jgi:hypothetical protein
VRPPRREGTPIIVVGFCLAGLALTIVGLAVVWSFYRDFYAGDGHWGARGRVVGVACDEARGSSIVETAGNPPGGRPIPGARVSLYLVLNPDGSPDRESPWSEAGDANIDGNFVIGLLGDPRLKKAGLEVSAPGYQSAYLIYQTTEIQPQTFLVSMRPSACG